MTTRKTVSEWLIMIALCSLMIGAAALIRNALEGGDPAEEEQTACWFLTPKVKRVLVADLTMWADHLNHNPDVNPTDWFNLREWELVELYSSKGITNQEAFECLTSLEPLPQEDTP